MPIQNKINYEWIFYDYKTIEFMGMTIVPFMYHRITFVDNKWLDFYVLEGHANEFGEIINTDMEWKRKLKYKIKKDQITIFCEEPVILQIIDNGDFVLEEKVFRKKRLGLEPGIIEVEEFKEG